MDFTTSPDYDTQKFKCPYCFFEMTHKDVLFRANTGFTAEELEEEDDSGFTMVSSNADRRKSQDLEIKRLFRRYDDETSFSSDKKLDEPLIQFWKSCGGSSGYVNADPKWDYPHIDPKDQSTFQQMIRMDTQAGGQTPGPDGFVRDSDGFILRVFDRFSNSALPMTRLCPHCHNPLPLPDYGKFPVIFIGVVGITSAGKTVYINQVLTHFTTFMYRSGYVLGPAAINVNKNEVVRQNAPLPSSTDDKVMRRPLAASLHRENDPSQGVTIVFYDIAGENCVPPDDTLPPSIKQEKLDRQAIIGQFISHCDGLIFLIDPEQVPVFSRSTAGLDSHAEDVQKVINVVTLLRSSWEDIPVSVVLTKSDLLKKNLDSNSLIFCNCGTTDQNGNPIIGFNREEFTKINRQLSEQFNANAYNIVASMNSFPQKAYFAVSAITCGVENRFEKHQNLYSFTGDNYQKFKSLIEWVHAWNSRSPESRAHYHPCPVRDVNGNPISFPCESAVTAENTAGITTEIFAESIQGGYVDRIQLDFWEIASESINPIGYPIADPNPKRIEEPLKWILWQKRLLAPSFVPSPAPTKRLLEFQGSYQRRLDAWQVENQENELRFYRGDDT